MSQASPADRVLAQIPPADQVILAHFFKNFLLSGGEPLGFTLFGNKPMTLHALYQYDAGTNTEKPMPDLLQNTLTFLKYQPLFGNTNFVFKKIVKPFYHTLEKDPALCDLMMLNRTACLGVIGKNLPLFRARFGPNATPQTILKLLEATDSPRELLGDCMLYGILFGFGTANSQAYKRFTQLVSFDILPKATLNTPTPSHEVWITQGNRKVRYLAAPRAIPGPGFNTAQAELDQLVQVFTGWPPENERDRSPIKAPVFRNLYHRPESQALTQSYRQQQAYIEQIYHRPDLLRLVTQQLLQPSPTLAQPAVTHTVTRQWVA
ncbi:hypothetical protein [Vampirovibrio chlorellavorus]|uniref:hypothetical protein n=1 Tax=Vampirovibrio chlorellavorus TaxID=758823 RepID=UPI0026EC2C4A|nr:hypothetical protein [Vampirovibrio chlorellavorus]